MKRRTATLATLVVSGTAALGMVTVAVSAGGKTTVVAGNFDKTHDVEFTAFSPSTVTIQQGGSVTFKVVGFHTITFPKRGTRGPAFIAPTGKTYAPQNDPAGVPYWWAGQPALGATLAAVAPSKSNVVTGRTLVNSGLPTGPKFSYTVKFPKAGTYVYECLVHTGMKGVIRVVKGKGQTHAQVALVTKREHQADNATGIKLVAADAKLPSTGTVVDVGRGTTRAQHLVFAPSKLNVKVGQVVTFKLAGRVDAHTITFGPKAYLDQVIKAFNQSLAPGKAIDPEVLYPSDRPGPAPVDVTSASHGNGFVNSGLLFDPHAGPGAHSFSVQFTQPGTFDFLCVLHSESMHGTVTVTP